MTPLDELVLNLTTICKLREGDKLSVYYGRFHISQNGWLRGIKRYVTGQNRNDTLQYIQTTVSYSLSYAKSITNNINKQCNESGCIYELLDIEKREELVKLYNTFMLTIKGLQELSNSYIDDRTCLSQIDVISNNISNFLEDCKEMGIGKICRGSVNYNLSV